MKRQLHLRLPNDLLTWIQVGAKAQGRSLNNFIVQQLLKNKLKQQEEDNATLETKDLQSTQK